MLDKQIHDHLDKQDKLEIGIEDDIDALMGKLRIQALIDDPEGVLLAFVAAISNIIEEDYAEESINNGIEFAKGVIKTKADIKIIKTKNPGLNKDETNSEDNGQD